MKEEFKVTSDIMATSGQRLANLFLDRIFFYIFTLMFGAVLGAVSVLFDNAGIVGFLDNNVLDILSSMILSFLMFFILESLNQKSIAKYISKTIVVMENGDKPDANTIALRTICRIIPFDAFSYLGTPTRGWHDTLSKTYVVDEDKFNNKKILFGDFQDLGKSEDEINFLEN